MGYGIFGVLWIWKYRVTGIWDIFAKTFWDMGYCYHVPPKQAPIFLFLWVIRNDIGARLTPIISTECNYHCLFIIFIFLSEFYN